jgi:hypothetical protein
MTYENLTFSATTEQDEILTALKDLIKVMGDKPIKSGLLLLSVSDEKQTTKIDLAVSLQEDLDVVIKITKDKLESDYLSFTFALNSDGQLIIVGGAIDGESIDFAELGKEYVITESLEELTNVVTDCLTDEQFA